MYVREKKQRHGGKTYTYWQLVQNSRVDGKARQTVIAHLGRLPNKLAAEVSARWAGLLCGADGCGRPGVEKRAAVVVRRGRKVEQTLLLCPEHAKELDAGLTLRSVALR